MDKKSQPGGKHRLMLGGVPGAIAILRNLDQAAEKHNFPDLVSFEWRYGAARMHCYSDISKNQWAIVIEEFTYSASLTDIDFFTVILYSFGNKLPKRNEKKIFFKPIKKGRSKVLCYDDENEENPWQSQRLHPDTKDIQIHGKLYPVSHKSKDYEKLGIKLEHEPEILKKEFFLWLADSYKNEIFATKKEIGIGLPEVLMLEDWIHPDTYEQKPSDSPTFQMIANVLEYSDPSM